MLDYFSTIPSQSEYVLCRKDGEEYKTLGDFKKAWMYCLDKARVVNFRFHDTRHHAASQLILKNVSEREVMQVAGWKTNMLSTYYNNAGTSASNAVYKALM